MDFFKKIKTKPESCCSESGCNKPLKFPDFRVRMAKIKEWERWSYLEKKHFENKTGTVPRN